MFALLVVFLENGEVKRDQEEVGRELNGGRKAADWKLVAGQKVEDDCGADLAHWLTNGANREA
jgi:hypothetical protein